MATSSAFLNLYFIFFVQPSALDEHIVFGVCLILVVLASENGIALEATVEAGTAFEAGREAFLFVLYDLFGLGLIATGKVLLVGGHIVKSMVLRTVHRKRVLVIGLPHGDVSYYFING